MYISDFQNIFLASIVDIKKVVQDSKSCPAIKVCSFKTKKYLENLSHSFEKGGTELSESMLKLFLRFS